MKWQEHLTSISKWRAVPGSSHSTLNFTPSVKSMTHTLICGQVFGAQTCRRSLNTVILRLFETLTGPAPCHLANHCSLWCNVCKRFWIFLSYLDSVLKNVSHRKQQELNNKRSQMQQWNAEVPTLAYLPACRSNRHEGLQRTEGRS